MARKPSEMSIYRMADEANVSVSTISRVMNNRTGVSDATRQKINEMLKKYNFKANYPTPPAQVAVVVHTERVLNDYSSEIFNGISSYLSKHNILASILFGNDDIKNSIRKHNCAGVIVLLPPKNKKAYFELSETGLPIMFIDEKIECSGTGYIDNDATTGIREGVEHLLELGHKNIAFMYLECTRSNMIQRFEAYKQLMQEYNIELHPENIIAVKSSERANRSLEKCGQEEILKLLAQNRKITALMTSTESLAYGAMCGIHKAKLRIPEDFSLIGFDDLRHSAYTVPPLTTINHPLTEEGYLAAQAIHKFVDSLGKEPLPRISLPTSLTVRESTAPVKQ